MKPKTMTGAALKVLLLPALNALADDQLVYFGQGDLSFYRPNHIENADGTITLQIEFNELYTTHEPGGQTAEGGAQVGATPSGSAAP